MDATFYFFLDILMSSTYIDKHNLCFHRTNRHYQFVIFLHPSLNKTSSNYRSDKSYRFCSRGRTGSSILDRDFRHLCLGRRIHTSGHSDFGIFINLGVSSSVIWVYADTASKACFSQSVNFAIICMIFVAVICDVDDLYSVNTAQASESSFTMLSRSSTHPLYFWSFYFNSAIFKWHMFIIEAKWTFLLCLCVSRMTSFLLPIFHGLTDTFIPFFFFLSTIHLYLDSRFLDLIEWENTLVLETLSRFRCQKHFLLEPNTVGTVPTADLRLLLLDFWCWICSETLSDALSW